MMRAGSWRSLTIATDEIPIVGDSTQQGAANRTLAISVEPFDDVREAQAMHHLVAAQHGTAGRAFIEALRRCPHGARRGDAREPDPLLARRPDGVPQVRAWRGSTQPHTARTVPRRSRRGSGVRPGRACARPNVGAGCG